ncbi:hypothetical protein O988_00053 [Pseudogymnoascus sp. VKM F-3808]|nr:hypothetical protein O988_00053 [Pseudogymnoascus sp. VKM F-3808]
MVMSAVGEIIYAAYCLLRAVPGAWPPCPLTLRTSDIATPTRYIYGLICHRTLCVEHTVAVPLVIPTKRV